MAANGDEDDFPPPPEPGQLLDLTTELEVKMPQRQQMERSHSTEKLEFASAAASSVVTAAAATMPRSTSGAAAAGSAEATLPLAAVSMRRSSSVPCKRLNSRGSTGKTLLDMIYDTPLQDFAWGGEKSEILRTSYENGRTGSSDSGFSAGSPGGGGGGGGNHRSRAANGEREEDEATNV